MINFRLLLSAVFVFGSLSFLPGTARAAQSYDNCIGFINSLPANITTQGTWCLKKDLATSMVSGNAITISANNVTIDCNGFKIGGLAAGNTSSTRGIAADGRQNATVRDCNVRGFYNGISLIGGAGHLVEDNRLDNNLKIGIRVEGDNNRVQRNRVYDTGGAPGDNTSIGIAASADVIGNTVAGVFASDMATYPVGIAVAGIGSEVRGNQVRGLMVLGAGSAVGIAATGNGMKVASNHISSPLVMMGMGVYGTGAGTFCTGNTVFNLSIAYFSCEHSIDNLPTP